MTKILVTGGGGFLGAWIVKLLAAQGLTPRLFDKNINTPVVTAIAGAAAHTVEWIEGDITDTQAVIDAAQGCAGLIHLAAVLTPPCRDNPIFGAQVNVIGTLNVFEAAKRHHIPRVVYASSGAVFGPESGSIPAPMTHYGAFKLACEGCARAYWHDAQIASIGFRPTIIYGPGREIGLTADISLACRAAARQQAYTIGFTGVQDLLYVEDTAAAFVAAALKPYQGAHAFSLTGGSYDVQDVISRIKTLVPQADLKAQGPLVPMASVIAKTPYEDVLGGLPHTPLQDGLAATIAYYQSK